jgi:hypothetical protein
MPDAKDEAIAKLQKDLEATNAKLDTVEWKGNLNTKFDEMRGNLVNVDFHAQVNMYALQIAYDNYEKVLGRARRSRQERLDPKILFTILSWAVPLAGSIIFKKTCGTATTYLTERVFGKRELISTIDPKFANAKKFLEADAKFVEGIGERLSDYVKKDSTAAKTVEVARKSATALSKKGVDAISKSVINGEDKLTFDSSKARLAIRMIDILAAQQKLRITNYMAALQTDVQKEDVFGPNHFSEAVRLVEAFAPYKAMAANAISPETDLSVLYEPLARQLERGLWYQWFAELDKIYWSRAYVDMLATKNGASQNGDALKYVSDLNDLKPIFERVNKELWAFAADGKSPYLVSPGWFDIPVVIKRLETPWLSSGSDNKTIIDFDGYIPDIRWYRTLATKHLPKPN